jgi:hypothetical protein
MSSQYSSIYKMMITNVVIFCIAATFLFFNITGFFYYIAYFFVILSSVNMVKLIRYLLKHKKTGSYF